MRLLFILLLLNSLQFAAAESDDGWTRSRKENEMFLRSRRYNDAADRVYDAMIQEYDLPGNDPQQQRDLFLQVSSNHCQNHPGKIFSRILSSRVTLYSVLPCLPSTVTVNNDNNQQSSDDVLFTRSSEQRTNTFPVMTFMLSAIPDM